MENYKIPPQARIGHVHLKVSDLQGALDLYCDILGFEIMARMGDQAAFISAGGYHHHIGLNTWYSKDQPNAQNIRSVCFIQLFYIRHVRIWQPSIIV